MDIEEKLSMGGSRGKMRRDELRGET